MNADMLRREVIIDGEHFSTLDGFFTETERVLTRDLPWQPGHCISSFNDMLRGGFGLHDFGEPLHIRWLSSEKSRAELNYTATAAYYAEILERCHPANRERFRARMEDALEQQGETLMDILCRIITDPNSGHDCTLSLE